MALSDPIADMLTRIRNAVRNRSERVDCLNSKVCSGIANVLKQEGYINDYAVIEDGRQGILRIELKYGPHGEQVINAMKPGGPLSDSGPGEQPLGRKQKAMIAS